jgi:uncharacterized phage protein (TIGR01671 family)
MLEYLFRGKTKETHEWVYGGIFVQGERYFIIKSITYECGATSWGAFEVDPETVGQSTGFYDCNNELIFEGDSVRRFYDGQLLTVRWDFDRFILVYDDKWFDTFADTDSRCTKIMRSDTNV